VTKNIELFINDVSGKVHVLERGSHSFVLCGGRADGPISIRAFRPAIVIAAENWCSHCIKKILMLVLANRLHFRPVLDYVLNRPAEKKETVIDSVRTELTFDSEEMAIKIIAGKTTGAKGNFTVQTKMELALGWDRLESFKDLTEELDEVEEVKMTIFSERRPD
jgi:hypothetical protein